jgi:hypothetical protein
VPSRNGGFGLKALNGNKENSGGGGILDFISY